MKLDLVVPVRIETTPMAGRRITRVYFGDREVPAEPVVMEAAARLSLGAPLSEVHLRRLVELGALRPEQVPPALPDRLALRPGVAMNLQLRPGLAGTPTARGVASAPVLPEETLPIDLYVPPLRLSALQRLSHLIQGAWAGMLRAAQGRGRAVDPDQATPVLVALVREALAQDAGLQLTLEIASEAPFLLRPLAPLQEETLQYPVAAIGFQADRSAEIAASLPRLQHALGDPGALPAVGTLLGLLGRGVHGAEAGAALSGQDEGARALLLGLLGAGMIEEAPARHALDDLEPGAVVHLGHATLLARLGEAAVLIDPWLLPASAADATAPLGSLDLPELSAILLTHHHWDHLNLESLLRLDKAVPIYVPAQPEGLALRPRSEDLLRALGFRAVHALRPGDRLRFEGGSVLALPFFGEDPTRIGWAGCCYALEHDGRAALVHVDSASDAAGHSLATSSQLAAAVADLGPLSPVFATRRQERGTLLEYGWPALLRPADTWARPTENADNDARALEALCRATRTGCLALYSEGGSDAYPTDTDFLRGANPRARDAVQQFLWDDLEKIRTAVGAPLHLSRPGERYVIGGGPLTSRR